MTVDGACRRFEGWQSLSPDRARAHLPSEIGRRLESAAVEGALERIASTLIESFPENLFCDLDALAQSLSRRKGSALSRTTEQVIRLHRLFGRGTPIRFRYVHDFLYGFDWARWVARDPAKRATVGPYDDAFLDYLEGRGHELLALIERDDAKYPTLRDAAPRNPFPFSREPEAEAEIHRSLARLGLIPVAAWSTEGPSAWDRPYVALREEEARRLGHGLATQSAGSAP